MTGAREEWRSITGFPRYQVSNRGRVRRSHRILKPDVSDSGHLRVKLYRSGHVRPVMQWVHRLVILAFTGNPVVRHLDDDETNNNADNLAWGSLSDNAGDALRNGRRARGETNGKSKLTAGRVRWIRKRKRAGVPYAVLAKRLGMSKAAVSAAGRGDTWACVTDVAPVKAQTHQLTNRRTTA